MEPIRLKLKSGIHEFEIEGDPESVAAEAAIWREWVASPGAPSASPPVAPSPPPAAAPQVPAQVANGTANPDADASNEDRRMYAKIFKHDGRVVSLTVIPPGAQRMADALLMVLFGQFVFNGGEPVTGQQLGDGMRMSGTPVDRVDRAWGAHMDTNVLASGVHRGIRYRLTNTGLARAREIAKAMLDVVP